MDVNDKVITNAVVVAQQLLFAAEDKAMALANEINVTATGLKAENATNMYNQLHDVDANSIGTKQHELSKLLNGAKERLECVAFAENVANIKNRLQRTAEVDPAVVDQLKQNMTKLNDQELVDFCRNIVAIDGSMPSLISSLMSTLDNMLKEEDIHAADFARLVLTSSHFNPDETYVVLDNELRSYTMPALASIYREKIDTIASMAAEVDTLSVRQLLQDSNV